jgi:hypothetical protein
VAIAIDEIEYLRKIDESYTIKEKGDELDDKVGVGCQTNED